MTVDEGRPLVRAFAPQEYETAARIEALAVAPDGTLQAAAGSDVITYDGARFDRIATTIPHIRALAASGDGARIYVGGDDLLGVIERGTFRSLAESLPSGAAPLGHVGAIATVGRDAWFAVEGKLLRLHERTLSVIGLDGPVALLPAADGLYVQRVGEGLFRIDGERIAAISNDPLLTDAPLAAVFPASDGLIAVSRRLGLIRLEAGRARIVDEGLAATLGADGAVSAARLPSGGFVIALSTGEILVTDSEGAIESRHALPGGAVSATTLDRDGSLWAATAQGLVQLPMLGAVTRFDEADGLPSASFAALTRHHGTLVLAAESGLYTLRPGAPDGTSRARFAKLPGNVSRPSDLLVSGGTLYAAGGDGIWRVETAGAVRVHVSRHAIVDLSPWSLDSDVVLAASASGLTVLRREDERLVEVKTFKNVGEVRSIVDDPETGIWLGTAAHGILRVIPAPGGSSWDEAKVTTYEAPGPVVVGVAPGGIFAVGPSRLYRYEATADAFRPDDRFSFDGAPLSRLWPVALAGPQRFWTAASVDPRGSDFPLARVERVAGGVWKLLPAPAPILEGLGPAGAAPILFDATGEDEVVWAGGVGAIYRIRSGELRRVPPRPMLSLYRAVRSDRAEEPERFAFGAPSLLPGSGMQYRWRLEGRDDAWSEWSASRQAEFASLPSGAYRLEVEARDRAGASAAPVSVRFRIPAPPWRSWWALSAYGLAAAALLWGALRLRKQRRDLALGEDEEVPEVEIEETDRGRGRLPSRQDAFSLTAVLRDVESTFAPQARERGIGFVVATRDLPQAPVLGDAQRLRQALEHVIGGALRVTERGEIRLTVIGELRSGLVHFAVSDTGPGFVPDEPEAQAVQTMSQGIVELLGGRLDVASQPGEGSTAHFSIVLQESSEETSEPDAARTWPQAPRIAPAPKRRPPAS